MSDDKYAASRAIDLAVRDIEMDVKNRLMDLFRYHGLPIGSLAIEIEWLKFPGDSEPGIWVTALAGVAVDKISWLLPE